MEANPNLVRRNGTLKLVFSFVLGPVSPGREWLFLELGRPDKAAFYWTEALRLSPHYPTAHYHLGQALAAQREWSEAAAEYRRALDEDPEYAPARAALEQGR